MSEIEALETRRLLSGYTFHTLASLNDSQLSATRGAIVRDGGGDIYFLALESPAASSLEGIYELAAGSGTPTLLYTFPTAQDDGVGGLAIDPSGDLFGTTNTGGNSNGGIVWELAAGASSITELASFNLSTTGNDPMPNGHNVVLDSAGDIFGTCQLGGADSGGTVWELPAGSGTITDLADFPKAVTNNSPNGLVINSAGDLFGTIGQDSTVSGAFGSVWELANGASTISVLASFDGANGSEPESPLVVDASGDVYGETLVGGDGFAGTSTSGLGTLYEIDHGSGAITTLYDFTGTGGDGRGPTRGLVADASGNIFGATDTGGDASTGSNNTPTGGGIVFELPAGSTTLTTPTTLVEFENATTGYATNTNILLDSSGDVFGITASGASGGAGVMYELTPGGSGGGGGGGGSTATSSLTGSLSGSIPASLVAGQKAKIKQTLTITDTASTAVTGPVSAKLYLSTDSTVDSDSIPLASSGKNLKLKPGAHSALKFKIAALSASVPAGTYHVVAEITDPSGNTSTAASAAAVTVAPPQIALTGSFAKQPTPGKAGKTALTFTVSDTGNTAATGTLDFNIDRSPDTTLADATAITTASKKINIKPGKSIKITDVASLPAGSYFVLIQLDPNNAFDETTLAGTTFASATEVAAG